MEVAGYSESVLQRHLNFETLCHLPKSEDEAYYARLRYANSNFQSKITRVHTQLQSHVGLSKRFCTPKRG